MAKPWSTPSEVPIDALPAGRRGNPDQLAFYEDALRRLEQTPAKKAIRYEFADYKTADRYATFVRNRAKKYLGANKVKASITNVGGIAVFVYRGPEW